jgi:hypothetical protein
MINVVEQPEPFDFDAKVRRPGHEWLKNKGIDPNLERSPGIGLQPYWRGCLDQLHQAYQHFCAYLAVRIERCTGAGTVDHFIAKSQRVDQAYEWSNYRLASTKMNSRKRDFDDVLDPFKVQNGWFRLELVSGRIYPSPDLSAELRARVAATIERLGLDDPGNREIRARHFQNYFETGYPEDYLRSYSPFVWSEARRQGLLKVE